MEDPTKWVHTKHPQYDVKRHKQERIENGFSVYDWWNFNSYLDWIIIQGLTRFKEGAGHPVTEDIQTMDDWRAVLDKMIAGFKAHDKLFNDYNKDTAEDDKAVWEEGSALFIEFYGSLWD